MLYRKNLPNWERWLRVMMGLALIVYGLFGASSLFLTLLALVGALVVIVTGFMGYCPACAVAGRKFVQPQAHKDSMGNGPV